MTETSEPTTSPTGTSEPNPSLTGGNRELTASFTALYGQAPEGIWAAPAGST